MFIWDFSVIVALAGTIAVGVVICLWILSSRKPRLPSLFKDAQAFKQCPYCSYVFLDYLNRKGLPCPRCHSYLDDIKEPAAMLKSKRDNQSGMVLMMVLMIVMIMMIMTITILTQSLNQSTSVQKQIDQIRQDQLAKGLFWKAHANQGKSVEERAEVVIDGKAYKSTLKTTGNTITVDVSSE